MKNFLYVFLVSLLLLTGVGCSKSSKTNQDGTYPDSYLNFPSKLSPITPYDVDISLEKKLLSENKIDEAQRLFDILAWQMFISVNWPREDDGKIKEKLSENGKREWDFWKESFEVFKAKGAAPTEWGSMIDLPSFVKVKNEKPKRVLYRTSKFSEFSADTADEINQAFTLPIWDQNGDMVRYEIRMNKPIVDYIVQNELYNIDGQIKFSGEGKKVNFPSGTKDKAGVMEIKIAWKVLKEGKDFPERYLTSKAYLFTPDSGYKWCTVGLVGMHISTKTESSPQWIWTTFEHIDNLETNALTRIHGKPLRPSFYDPYCPICPINKFPDTTKTIIKNQIQRILPIPKATQEINRSVQALLAKENSPLQYYQLIGAQWPTAPSSPPYPNPAPDSIYTLPEAVSNKSGGKPIPLWVTNMVMETYFQGATNASRPVADSFNITVANEQAFRQIEGFPSPRKNSSDTRKLIFGTESCMGCHSSAGIHTSFDKTPVRTADFEWLIALKAQRKSK